MKNSSNYRYSEISSFEDFHVAKERLILKSKIIEMKINYNFISIRKIFSVSNLFFSMAKEVVIPKISSLLSDWLKKDDK